MNTFMIGRLYNFGAFKQLFFCWKGIIATIVMAITLIFVKSLISTSLLGLFSEVLFGVIIYSIVLLILREDELLNILHRFKGKNKF